MNKSFIAAVLLLPSLAMAQQLPKAGDLIAQQIGLLEIDKANFIAEAAQLRQDLNVAKARVKELEDKYEPKEPK